MGFIALLWKTSCLIEKRRCCAISLPSNNRDNLYRYRNIFTSQYYRLYKKAGEWKGFNYFSTSTTNTTMIVEATSFGIELICYIILDLEYPGHCSASKSIKCVKAMCSYSICNENVIWLRKQVFQGYITFNVKHWKYKQLFMDIIVCLSTINCIYTDFNTVRCLK